MGNFRKNAARTAVSAFVLFILALSSAPGALALDRELVPMGCVVGISMKTDGVMVAGLSPLETDSGNLSPAGEAGILPGDVIVRLGKAEIKNAEDFLSAAGTLSGSAVSLTVRRGGKTIQYTVMPKADSSGCYKLGMWLRDSVQGIGTVTYLDPETGAYGALGHGINDVDSGAAVPLGDGSILSARVVDIKPGQAGCPGELHGSFREENVLGSIEKNTCSGIFGIMNGTDAAARESLPVADEDEICLGPAAIMANIDGCSVEEYSVEIVRLYNGQRDGRCMMLSVTDPRLLEKTGGIVQGMSGSPIIQNGKFIGAVTHVLINDPTRGYGISIENMLDAAA